MRQCSASTTATPCTSTHHYPRSDPVTIFLLHNPAFTHVLLTRSPHFQPGVYSCAAGFVESGESVEEAVRREAWEEVGVKVGRVRYHSSQPWYVLRCACAVVVLCMHCLL
jgi:NAD+ diphosphatase